MKSLLIRTDAGASIGHGHAMRCLALAQAARSAGCTVTFLMRECPPPFVRRLRSEGFSQIELRDVPGSLADARVSADAAAELSAEWLILDGYQFGPDFQREVRRGKPRVLVVDDYGHCPRYEADLILNQNISANAALYDGRAAGARYLLGPSYILLREEFIKSPPENRNISDRVERVLVTMGGADPDNLTSRALIALRGSRAADADIRVIIGGSFNHAEAVEALCRRHSATLLRDVHEMRAQMTWADLAIAAGGSTNWEMAFLGLPAVVIAVAENQRGSVEGLAAAGIVVSLGFASEVTDDRLRDAMNRVAENPAERRLMSERGQKLVDGRGTLRVLAELGLS